MKRTELTEAEIEKWTAIARVIRAAVQGGGGDPAYAGALLVTATVTVLKATTDMGDADIAEAMRIGPNIDKAAAEQIVSDVMRAMIIEMASRGRARP